MKYKINYKSIGGTSSSSSSSNNIRNTDIKLKYIFDNDSLRDAVNKWCNNNYDARIQYGDINTWDVSQVTDMTELFKDKYLFNDNISNWDTSNVTSMEGMFEDAKSFDNGGYPLITRDTSWNTSNVKSMEGMFYGAESFNSNISNWNTSNVTNMEGMFYGAESFNSNISNWNTSNVTNMKYMFEGAKIFNQDIYTRVLPNKKFAWDVSKVVNMSDMFNNAELFNGNISNWNTSKVTNMNSMFKNAKNFDGYISIEEDYETSSSSNPNNSDDKLCDMYGIIKAIDGDLKFQNINTKFIVNKEGQNLYNAWDVSNVKNMDTMFNNAILFNGNISNWKVYNVTNMNFMFYFAKNFTDYRIGLWPININAKFISIFLNSGITKDSFVDENNNKKISYNRLIAKYFNLPEEYMSIMVTGVGTNIYQYIIVNPIDRIIDVKEKLRNDIKNDIKETVEDIRSFVIANESLEEKELKEQVKNYNKSFYDKYPIIINRLVEETRNLNIDKLFTPYLQRFILGGKELDNNRTLISYEIKDNDTLYLLLMDHIVIYVKTLTGKTDTFKVNPEDTIVSVKQLIMNKNNIPIERQRLIFNSHQLRDNRYLYNYNIINKSTLHLVLKIQQEQNL